MKTTLEPSRSKDDDRTRRLESLLRSNFVIPHKLLLTRFSLSPKLSSSFFKLSNRLIKIVSSYKHRSRQRTQLLLLPPKAGTEPRSDADEDTPEPLRSKDLIE
ncbi:hypothetical protein M5K25_004038 [Dendrobium thyrsiflorum]|uniref:Uncharacterized protein n=1 Tax=Dendrobium thyrsiflorum TaxID=117978 RepID=A0ABD0VM35_DENTH